MRLTPTFQVSTRRSRLTWRARPGIPTRRRGRAGTTWSSATTTRTPRPACPVWTRTRTQTAPEVTRRRAKSSSSWGRRCENEPRNGLPWTGRYSRWGIPRRLRCWRSTGWCRRSSRWARGWATCRLVVWITCQTIYGQWHFLIQDSPEKLITSTVFFFWTMDSKMKHFW